MGKNKNKSFNNYSEEINKNFGIRTLNAEETEALMKILKDSSGVITQANLDTIFYNEDDLWKLEMIFGKEKLNQALILYGKSYSDIVKHLFQNNAIYLYTDKMGLHLFSYSCNLFIEEYGELYQLSGINALNRYGLKKIEQAYNKGFTTI